ncbi:MAG: hypoxanthine phosphoribosyltransferase [Deltaproteobacteria bacterium]|nr:hypoxanthine phosphoribosyltransferase [Deltaproteobacteria bacterium]
MNDKNLKLMHSPEEIARRVQQLGLQIDRDYKGEEIVVIGVLKGAAIFLSDLVRQLRSPVRLDFVQLASYGSGHMSSGIVELLKDVSVAIEGKNVLIVEDIVDSGRSLAFLYQKLRDRNPRKLKVCVLLDKKERRVVPFEADYVGLDVPDVFLVGYGLDYAERYRNLPGIYEMIV